MANELSWALLQTNAGVQEVLSGILRPLLYDPTDLRGTMMRMPFIDQQGSIVTKTVQYSRDQPFAAASSELVGGFSNRDIGDQSYTHSLTRYGQKWTLTELWRRVAPNGSIDLGLLADVMNEGVGLTFTDLLCALFPSLSTTVGSPTDQMSLDIMFDAQYALNLTRARPPYNLVVSPHGYNRLVDSIKGQGGSIAMDPATRRMLDARGPGPKFLFGNINVWDSDSVTLDGGATYRRGAMYDSMCFEYQLASAQAMGGLVPPSVTMILNGILRIIAAYDNEDAITKLIGDFYASVVETEDARGVEVRHLAA